MLTLNFLFYLLAVGLAFLFRLSYLGWFGSYLLYCVILVPIFLLFLSLPSMLSARLELSAPQFTTRGSPANLQIHCHNKRFLPISSLYVWLEVDNRFAGEHDDKRLVYRCVGNEDLTSPLPTEFCGVLQCRIACFECRDLLGLFAVRKSCVLSASCTVLPPACEPEPPIRLDALLDSPAKYKPKYGGGYSEEHDLRDYRPGDTINSIHWKMSAKMDSVIVREPLVRENNEIFLVLLRVGKADRGLEILYWLSLELCRRELPHTIVGNQLYSVENEEDTRQALYGILRAPMSEPCGYDGAMARCIFQISAGEVRML